MLAPLGLVVSYGRLDGPPDPGFVEAMRRHHATSPAVRFFTIHSFDDRPDIRAAAGNALIGHLAERWASLRLRILDRLTRPSPSPRPMLESGEVIGKPVSIETAASLPRIAGAARSSPGHAG